MRTLARICPFQGILPTPPLCVRVSVFTDILQTGVIVLKMIGSIQQLLTAHTINLGVANYPMFVVRFEHLVESRIAVTVHQSVRLFNAPLLLVAQVVTMIL